MIITIDGPLASGKSTVASLVARELNIYYINSGYLYRTIAYLVRAAGIPESHFASLTRSELDDLLQQHSIEYRYADGKASVWVDGADITNQLKTGPAIDRATSVLS